MDFLYSPWPWYVGGPMIALVMFLLLINGKKFGISSNLRTFCTLCGAGKNCRYFCFDWKKQRWNLMVVLGAIAGGFIAAFVLTTNDAVNINRDVVSKLNTMGFHDAGAAYLPGRLFDISIFTELKPLALLALGGFLVGFGARYAGGCTSGHAISGLSDIQLASLIAVIGFFIGGLIMIHILFPVIF